MSEIADLYMQGYDDALVDITQILEEVGVSKSILDGLKDALKIIKESKKEE